MNVSDQVTLTQKDLTHLSSIAYKQISDILVYKQL